MEPQIVAFTGAGGRLGRRVIPLLEKSWPITGLDLHPGRIGNTEIHAVDLLNEAETMNALKGVHAVVHSAIAPYPEEAVSGPDHPVRREYHHQMLEVNIKGTYHVFEAARRLGIPRVVYISSMTVVTGADSPDFDNKELVHPRNLYACTKLFGEQLAQVYQRTYGIRTISLRLGQPYPIGMKDEEKWIKTPKSRAMLVNIEDVAQAIDGALRTDEKGAGVYHIVSRDREGFPLPCSTRSAPSHSPSPPDNAGALSRLPTMSERNS